MRRDLKLRTSTWVIVALDALADSGRFGRTPEAVAEELLRAQLREVELEGWIGRTAPIRAVSPPPVPDPKDERAAKEEP